KKETIQRKFKNDVVLISNIDFRNPRKYSHLHSHLLPLFILDLSLSSPHLASFSLSSAPSSSPIVVPPRAGRRSRLIFRFADTIL
ncbi:hypothetical protein G4B88_002083, partial [Cannabis sativa]